MGPVKRLPGAWLLLGVALLAGGAVFTWSSLQDEAHHLRAEGKVVSFDVSQKCKAARVEFDARDGSRHTLRDSNCNRGLSLGDKVEVLYAPEDADDATIYTGRVDWLALPVALMVIGAALALAALITLLRRRA